MLEYPDRTGSQARERHQALLDEAEAWRLANTARPRRPSVVRRGARLLGERLVALGVGMMRYGQTEVALPIELNAPQSSTATMN